MIDAHIEPENYDRLNAAKRKALRERYVLAQRGMCCHCHSPLDRQPPADIKEKRIDWNLFPPGFLKRPVHLHHCHKTSMTIGAVHARCNAVLWQYHGE